MRYLHYLLVVALFFSCVSISKAQFAGGDGTESNPWQIATIEQLDSVRNYLDGNFELIANLDFTGTVYDSVNSSEGWIPIGNTSGRFTGTFIGSGYTINNLYINRVSVYESGLFGYITDSATIYGLGIVNCFIKGTDDVGGLVGKAANHSNIIDCYVTGKVSGDDNIGGLVGENGRSTIINCYAAVEVMGNNNTGDLVGYCCYSADLNNCYAMGSVSGNDNVGGLVGYFCHGADLDNCYAVGSVSGNDNVGGLVGYSDSFSHIDNSYATGRVSGNDDVGALVGVSNNHSNSTNCFFNIETSGQDIGIGVGNGSAVGLTINEMKQQSSYESWDFSTVWNITNGTTFPRLQTVYNNPLILHDLSSTVCENTLYTDTVHIIEMDTTLQNIFINNYPVGMALNDSIITWIASDSIGNYSFTVEVEDENGAISTYTQNVEVVSFSGGNGTASDPYQITTIAQLDSVRHYPDMHYILMNNLDFNGTTYDSINSTEGWLPIIHFSGTFNGNGHIINHLYINRPEITFISLIGLFGFIDNAAIEDLGVVNCNIYGGDPVGCLVGTANTSSIINCYSTGNVVGVNSVGGLVGHNYIADIINCYSNVNVLGGNVAGGLVGINNTSTITNCYSTGRVSGGGTVGGLVGRNSDNSNLINCYFNTEVSGQSSGIGEGSGSITGLTTVEMKQQSSYESWDFSVVWDITNGTTFPRLQNNYNYPVILHDLTSILSINTFYTDTIHSVEMDATIQSISLSNYPTGMILNDSIITWTAPSSIDSYTFTVEVEDENGAISLFPHNIEVVSYTDGSGTADDPFQITTITQLEDVRYYLDKHYILMNDLDFNGSVYDSINSTYGWLPIGTSMDKFTGTFNGNGHVIYNLYINRSSSDNIGLFGYTTEATINSLGIVNCTINGSDSVGSLVGFVNENTSITHCYSSGSISGDYNVGGLVGCTDRSDITKCYSSSSVKGVDKVGGFVGCNISYSDIENCYATGDVSGVYNVGGFVGYSSFYSSERKCYAIGSVSGDEIVGAFSGQSFSSGINYCYFNIETSGQINGTGNGIDYVTGLTTLQMKQQSNFDSYDFSSVWEITNGTTFPRLRNVYNYPIILHDLSKTVTRNILYVDTIRTIEMDATIQSILISNAPSGMNFNDSVITWIAQDTLSNSASLNVNVADENGSVSAYTHNIRLIPFAGSGTSTDPYQITNIEQLDSVHNYLDKHFILMNDLDFNGSVYDNINSIYGWLPIGNSTDKFTGTFNGNGHVIYNLYINRLSYDYIGLFGCAEEAIIDSLGLEHCNIKGQYGVGSLVGRVDQNSLIENCYSTGSIDGVNQTGGLTGIVWSNSSIKYCNFCGNVTGIGSVGGLIGYCYYNTIIKNCSSFSRVQGEDHVGGLIGVNSTDALIEDSFSIGSVKGIDIVGGLVGGHRHGASIINCYSIEKVYGEVRIGGLVGSINSNSNTANCYSVGSVLGKEVVGGFAGYTDYASSVTNCYSSGSVSGELSAGAFIGYMYSNYNEPGVCDYLTLTSCYYNTDVSMQDAGIGDGNEEGIGDVTGLTITQMKQQNSFEDWNFSDVWKITNGTTFPRLQNIYNYPIVMHDLSNILQKDVMYVDTIHTIEMDTTIQSISLNDFPSGMTLNDSIIAWTPAVVGDYFFSIEVEDENEQIATYLYDVKVVPFAGDGTEDNPFQITTVEQLDFVRTMPGKHYILMNDLDFTNSAFDSVNNALGWEPIGGSSEPFTGTFNGNGHIISNLYINRPSTNNIGLFGCVEEAIIDSLGIVNFNIEGEECVGSLVGYANYYSIIKNCYAIGSVSGSSSVGGLVGLNTYSKVEASYSNANVSGNMDIGGLIGDHTDDSTVENCYAAGCVSGYSYAGGLVGWYSENSMIKNSYSVGKVTGDHGIGAFLGGSADNSVSNCFYNNETSGQLDGTGYGSQVIAGLTTAQMQQNNNYNYWDFSEVWSISNGNTFPRLQNLYNYPVILHDLISTTVVNSLYTDIIHVIEMDATIQSVTLSNHPEGMVLTGSIITWTPTNGGIYNFTIEAEDENGKISTYEHSIVVIPFEGNGTEADPYQITTIEELNFVRNFPDKHFILMNDLDFSGSPFDSINSTNGWFPIGDYLEIFTGTFNGNDHIINNLYINRPSSDYVGLFGYVGEGTISHLGLANCNIAGYNYVGALAGRIYNSSIENCYVNGSVSGHWDVGGLVGHSSYFASIENSYSIAVVLGKRSVGGLVGSNSSVIENCYAAGSVSGESYYVIGGFVGSSSANSITNCYFNTDISGQLNGIGLYYDSNPGLIALTIPQMQQQDSYNAWDFSLDWNITNGETFPRLQTMYNYPVVLHDLTSIAYLNTLYTDTIHTFEMDAPIQNISISNIPAGMILNDTIITWIPNTVGVYTFIVEVEDENGAVASYTHKLNVIPFEGDGTQENPYQIASIQELDFVRNLPDKHYILMNDLDFTGTAYDSLSSIHGWLPIGQLHDEFSGSFDGNGYTINNLYIDRPSSDYVGLFGYVGGATISNLGLDNCNVTGNNNVGSILGVCNDSSVIIDCFTSGVVHGMDYIGGLVGESETDCTIKYCYTNGTVSGRNCVGGFIGRNFESTIECCYSTGSVSGNEYIGGFAGVNRLYITNCYSLCNITGSQFRAGGLVGYNIGNLSSCYSAGIVLGNEEIGAFIGYNGYNSDVTDCYFDVQTTEQIIELGYGYDGYDCSITGMSTIQMKQQSSFTGFDFDTVWGIQENNTYPVLLAFDNAPFTFSDIVFITGFLDNQNLLSNDYDYETMQADLICRLDSCSDGDIVNNVYQLPSSAVGGDEFLLYYTAGETSGNDTVWGNTAKSFIYKTNTVPEIISSQILNVDETASNGTSVGTVLATDTDGTTTFSWWTILSGNTDGIFRINASTGEITVEDNSNLDFETTTSYNLSLIVSDGVNVSTIETITIFVNDMYEYPVITSLQTFDLQEDATNETSVGMVEATDANVGTVFSDWTITAGNTDEIFAINSSTGEITVEDNSSLDFETIPGYTLSLTVSDGENISEVATVVINIINVNDNAPVIIPSQSFDLSENADNETGVGIVLATDADADTAFSGWTIVSGNVYGIFAINSSTGKITVEDNSSLDFETIPSYTLSLTVSDGENISEVEAIIINVLEYNSISGRTGEKVKIYPNPFDDKLYIEVPDDFGFSDVVIYNNQGEIVYSTKLKGEKEIDLGFLAKGFYIIRFTHKQGMKSEYKIIKQ